jgi:hypothetical protein
MEPFRALIAGGGVAAIEGLLRLRRLAPDIDVTLLAPNEEFAFRALSVKEPFAMGTARRYPLEDIAASANAKWLRDGLSWIDTEARAVHTTAGETLPFDALLVAVGGEMVPAFTHARTYRDAEADDIFGGVVQDIEGGYSKSVAFLAPDGPAWPLPLYELALMTAERAEGMGASVELCVVTPEPAPLASFGGAAGEAVVELLDQAGVTVYASAQAQVPAARHLLVQPHGVELTPDGKAAQSAAFPVAPRASSLSTTTVRFRAPADTCTPPVTPPPSRSSTGGSAPSRPIPPRQPSPAAPAPTWRPLPTGRCSAGCSSPVASRSSSAPGWSAAGASSPRCRPSRCGSPWRRSARRN